MNTPLPATTTEFQPFPKMARLSRECVITEKLDGTNAQIAILPVADVVLHDTPRALVTATSGDGQHVMLVGSRTRWIRPKALGEKGDPDNYNFAAWCRDNATELFKLGEGRHFGEWYGRGINRSYGLDVRRFALFNTNRWLPLQGQSGVYCWSESKPGEIGAMLSGPACCEVVPVIWRGEFDTRDVQNAVEMLRSQGSFAVPGFMNPEGVVCYHIAAGLCFKKTLDNDASPKSLPGFTNPRQLSAGVEAAKHAFTEKCAENPCVSVACPTHGLPPGAASGGW